MKAWLRTIALWILSSIMTPPQPIYARAATLPGAGPAPMIASGQRAAR